MATDPLLSAPVRKAPRAAGPVGAAATRHETASGPKGGEPDAERRVPLYRTGDVRDALGLALGCDPSAWDVSVEPPPRVAEDTEHQARLRSVLAKGEDGRWRDLAGPTPHVLERLRELGTRAPHLDPLTQLVELNLRAARAMGRPCFLEPVLLVGGPGVGKTWFLSRLGRILGLPFRSYAMSSSSLSEGLTGSHPSWRNSGPGLVARTLLTQSVANPIFFVDEVDKGLAHSANSDPYRPFYVLLEQEGARSFTDEYLGFPIDASRALWVLAANDASALPAAVLDRLLVVEVPEMGLGQRVAVARSVYADANAARGGFFAPDPAESVVERLAALTPRAARAATEHAMAIAAADGRRSLLPDDVRSRRPPGRPRMGFV